MGFAVVPTPATLDANGLATAWFPPRIFPTYSADGVHWHQGKQLKVAADTQIEVFRSVIEGPGGLVAVGWTGACDSEWVDSLWTSTDGISWKAVDINKAFGASAAIAHISGGAAGYVAVNYRDNALNQGGETWTSKDGRIWQPVPLNSAAFNQSLVDDGSAVAGSFVLAGTAGDGSCDVSVGPQPTPVLRTASIWWSADSSTWTRVALPGAVASAQSGTMSVCRLDDHAIVVSSSLGGTWGSNDGRTWRSIKLPIDVAGNVITGGQQSLVVEFVGKDPAAPAKILMRSIDDNFALVPIAQKGSVPSRIGSVDWTMNPSSYGLLAIGPTGVLVTNATGTRLWFGEPSE